MQKIKILNPQEAIKIAAGEVVERPSHILKELIENSIDAGATTITIHCKKAGKELLSITDNGCGMSPQDARLCFAHHATSKISTVHDLESINTYGFRGEALSSIASVAHVQLTTKTDNEKSATQLTLECCKIISETIAAHPTGTTIIITNLFDTIPARKKFLKSNDTEWNAILSIFQAFCLRYCNIQFKLFHDDKLAYNCPTTPTILQRCAQLWNNELHDQLIEFEPATKNGIILSGATTKSHYHRYNRNQIFTFVNNRWVKNIELSRAILKGYQNVLPNQKYPATFLFVDIDPTCIDINIHPKKEEIKFLHPGIVQTFIQETITKTLNKTVAQSHNATATSWLQTPTFSNVHFAKPLLNLSKQSNKKNSEIDPIIGTINKPVHNFFSNSITKAIPSAFNETFIEEEFYTIIGQFHATYILIEQTQELLIVDQHAAHERILYEQFKKNFDQVATVQLLFPQIVKLSEQDVTLITEHTHLFASHGIVFERFSDTEIIVQSTPVSLQHKAIVEIIQITLAWIKEHQTVDKHDFFKQLNESIHTQKACKMACKAGDILNQEQMQNIVQTLFKTENRFCCPHGRPSMWQLSIKEIEKFFKRDYKSKQNIGNII